MPKPSAIDAAVSQLMAGCKDVVSEADLKAKLIRSAAEHRPLRVKLGIDASGPDIHLGFVVVLDKLRQFQDLGHTAVLVVGDFTGKIGDPSGRSKTRPQLTDAEIKANMARYREQVFKILIPAQTEVVCNSQWSNPLTAREIVQLSAKLTLARIIEREDFRNRLSQGLPLGLHEILYPLFQAYDSVAVRADVELGGADQYWNLLMGRELQRELEQEPQVVMTCPLLEGTDGKLKMSKSYGNYIGVAEPPREIYGKTMSIPDSLIVQYFRLATLWGEERVSEVENALRHGDNPRNWKARLAHELVARFYDDQAADLAAKDFDAMFRQDQPPADMPEYRLRTSMPLVEVIVNAGLLPSRSETRRKITEGAVYLDGERMTDIHRTIDPGSSRILRVGKRKFLRII